MNQPITTITPMVRTALLAGLSAPGGTLKRGRHGFGPVTRRTANLVHSEGLMQYDNADFPKALTLTAAGREIAERLQAALRAPKAARAWGGNHHADDYVDGAAYFGLAGEAAAKGQPA